MKQFKCFSFLCLLCLLCAFSANEKNEGVPQRVYMYGASIDFNDSVTYVTDIQGVDSVVLTKEGFLPGYQGYSFQLKYFLETNYRVGHRTCAVYFSSKKNKLEKQYLKHLRKVNNNKSVVLKKVESDVFRFEKVD